MLTINEPVDSHLSNMLKGLAILLGINSKAKVMLHKGAIDVVLSNDKFTVEQYRSLTILGWLELSDYSWRYRTEVNPWIALSGKYKNDPHYDEVLEHIEQYRHDLDEEVGRHYDQEYEIVEERLND